MSRHDRGLHALARVREVRERDSRIGLQQALSEQQRREATLAELERSVREHGAFAAGDMNQFVALRESLRMMSEAAALARAERDSAAVVASSASAHWQADKTRLSAVENLLENRAGERRAEQDREAVKVSDETAGQLWLRQHAPGAETASTTDTRPAPRTPRTREEEPS